MKKFFLFLSLTFTPWAFAITVNYKVPTTNPDLLKFADFSVNLECTKINGVLNLKYRYPVELTGVPADIEFRQSRLNPNFFFGENGEMSCDATNCSVKYFDLPFDKTALRSNLEGISKNAAELSARIELAFENIGDPGGIFESTPMQYCGASSL